jgi:hypothetical protein
MLQFKYQYKDKIFKSTAKPFSKDNSLHYLVILPDETEVSITPLEFPGTKQEFIWNQSGRLDEIILSYELVQAMGEGLERVINQ